MTVDWPQTRDTCTCGHDDNEHARGRGRCTGLDSYDCPCACPSFEHDTNLDDEHREPEGWVHCHCGRVIPCRHHEP